MNSKKNKSSMHKVFRQFLNENRFSILCLGGLLALVNSLYVFIPFGTVDDYERTWGYILSPQAMRLDLIKSHIMDGRFFTGVNLWIFFKPGSISYLGIYRLLNIGLLFVFSTMLYYSLTRVGSKTTAFLLTIIICTLPSFSAILYFASLVGVVMGAILAGLAAWIVKDLSIQTFALSKNGLNVFISSIMLLFALQYYQPIAMVYWVIAAIVLFKNSQGTLKQFLGKYAVFIIVFAAANLAEYLLISVAPSITGYPVKPRTDVLGVEGLTGKIIWFFNVVLPQSLNFFLLRSLPKTLVIFVSIYISGGIFLFLKGILTHRLVKILIFLTIIPLAYFPNLVTAENWASYRSMVALCMVWVVLIFFGTKGYIWLIRSSKVKSPHWAKVGLTVWVGLAIVLSLYHSVAYIIFPGFMEHRIIHSNIIDFKLQPGDEVFVSMPNYLEGASPFVYGDEFGIPTTAYKWGAQNLTNLVLCELGFQSGQIKVTVFEEGEIVPINHPKAHFLDLETVEHIQLKSAMVPIEKIKNFVTSIY